MTNKHNASRNDFIFPINQWIALDSLTPEQLEAAKEGPFEFEWHLGFRHGREVLEAKISKPNNA